MAPSGNTITLDEFNSALSRYAMVVQNYGKSAKNGSALEELDEFRYVEAPALFSINGDSNTLKLSDILKLVEWKLTHGHYRPGFTARVKKNSEDNVNDILEKAFGQYAKDQNVPAAIRTLSELVGIGPATASLILAVHAPDSVLFFSDEVFQWLVNDGDNLPRPKYTAKEFEQISERSKPLLARLHVSPIAIEKVAFVLMHEGDGPRKVVSESERPKKKSEHLGGSGINVKTAASERKPRVLKPIVEKVTKKTHARKTPIKGTARPAKSIDIPSEKASDDEFEAASTPAPSTAKKARGRPPKAASTASATGAATGKKRGRPAKVTPDTSATGTSKKRGRSE